MNWLEAAFGLADAEPAAAPAKPSRQAPKVRSFWCGVRQPSGGDLGETTACHYYVEGDTLTLCDQDGKSSGEPYRLAPGESERAAASRLKREAWTRESGRSAFNNRRLNYGPLGFA